MDKRESGKKEGMWWEKGEGRKRRRNWGKQKMLEKVEEE